MENNNQGKNPNARYSEYSSPTDVRYTSTPTKDNNFSYNQKSKNKEKINPEGNRARNFFKIIFDAFSRGREATSDKEESYSNIDGENLSIDEKMALDNGQKEAERIMESYEDQLEKISQNDEKNQEDGFKKNIKEIHIPKKVTEPRNNQKEEKQSSQDLSQKQNNIQQKERQ